MSTQTEQIARTLAVDAFDVASDDDRATMSTWDCWPLPGDVDHLAEQIGRRPTAEEISELGEAMCDELRERLLELRSDD